MFAASFSELKSSTTIYLLPLLCFLNFFLTIWGFFELLIRPQINTLPNEWIPSILNTAVIKNLAWTIPAMFLITKYKQGVQISLKDMFTTKVYWLKYVWLLVAFTLYLLFMCYIKNKSIIISPDFKTTQFITVLFVGLTEELVFRGWLLNATITEKNKWVAILINAIMFLSIHFPRWISEGSFIANFANLGFISIIGLSIIFSLAFLKSKNIIVPIVLHMYWDLITFIF